MSAIRRPSLSTPSPVSPNVAHIESILPYTQGLTGVNLWLNNVTGWSLFAALAFLLALVLIVRTVQFVNDYIRLLVTINLNERQLDHWTHDTSTWRGLKKHVFSAPLFRKRHNREIQLSRAANIGTLPSRLHTILLTFYFFTNVIYCLLLDYDQPLAALRAEIRGRTGHLVVINMMPLFLFAARNNPLIPMLGISFDTFNLFHRWIGRIVVIEAIAHTFIWGINLYWALGLDGINDSLATNRFLQYGLMSSVAVTLLLIQSPSVIRHAFYETFLHLHQFLAAAMFVGVLLHVESQALPQKPFMYFLIAMWALERFTRIFRMLLYNVSRHGITKVHIIALEGGACRATFNIRRTWTTTPGCHIFAYIPSIAWHMSHPFSVAWHDDQIGELARPSTKHESITSSASSITLGPDSDFSPLPKRRATSVSCIISRRTGMTDSLYRRAKSSPHGITLTAFIEGPYGGTRSLRSYATVLLFAGGVGITHQLSHLKDLISSFPTGSCATRKLTLVWTVRTPSQLAWAEPFLSELMSMDHAGREVKLLLYVSKPPNCSDQIIPELKTSYGTRIYAGRANVKEILKGEVKERVGAMTVGVCGPGALADDVRCETRRWMGGRNVEFWEEAFTW